MQSSPELRNFLNQQACNNFDIYSEFIYTTQQHVHYHPSRQTITPRKPRASKPIKANTKKQVFYYYLNMLSQEFISKFNSLNKSTQERIMLLFRNKPITSSKHAISMIQYLINAF